MLLKEKNMTRKISKIAIALLSMLILCLLCLVACEKKYSAKYTATIGGSIEGETTQTILENQSGTKVTAISDNGYRFIGWSDGTADKGREDTLIENLKVEAKFEQILVSFVFDQNNTTTIPLLSISEKEESFFAPIKYGYSYNGWLFEDENELFDNSMDALTQINQKLSSTEGIRDLEDITLKINYKPIFIDFYAGEYLVRQVDVNELSSLDTTKLVAYSSIKDFDGWEFSDQMILENPELENVSDPLSYILNKYQENKVFNCKNFEVQAKFKNKVSPLPPNKYFTIAHAMGGIDNTTYVGTKEAFLLNYQLGHRFFEVDVSYTTDNKLVVYHSDGFNPKYDYQTFMEMSEEGKTYLDIDNLFEIIVQHPDSWFDIDILSVYCSIENMTHIEAYEMFYNDLNIQLSKLEEEERETILNRIILEITPNERDFLVEEGRKIGLKNFLYLEFDGRNYINTHKIENTVDFVKTMKWCSDNGVKFISWQYFTPETAQIAKIFGVTTFAFTYNNPITIYEFLDMGVDCVFTDFVFI